MRTPDERSLTRRVSRFFSEARRRKVWVTAAAYAALAIGLTEIVNAVSAALLFPAWTARLVTFLLILGFPVVLVMAWIFDISSEGLRRTGPARAKEAPGASAGTGSGGAAARPEPRRPGTAMSSAPAVARSLRLPEAPARRAKSVSAEDEAPAAPPDPDRVKRVALAHVRHELRTPINAILGYSEMLREEGPDEETDEVLVKIHDAGRRLLSLVDGILEPARLEGRIDRDIASFGEQIRADLRTPINSVVGYAEMLVEGAEENDRADMIPDLERILGAARGLLEASGDIVALATAAPEATAVPERLADSSQLAREVLSRISPPAASGTPAGQGSLLVVDDNETNRDLLSRQLAGHGYMVATAGDGEEALALLQRGSFDLVLLDVIMPRLDGVATLRRIKSDEKLAELPVIMLSSLDETESALRCLELGAEEYLSKPVQGRLLEARIETNLELRRMRERERVYRERIEADDVFIERLLTSALPSALAKRVRAGQTQWTENVPTGAVLALAVDLRNGAGPEELPALLSETFETVRGEAAERGLEACVLRPRGVLVAAAASETVPGDIARLADLAIALETGDVGRTLRGGLHAGPFVAGLVGGSGVRFDLWGEGVDTAEAVADRAAGGAILVSPTAHGLLNGDFHLDSHGVGEVAGKGRMRLHTLRSRAT